MTDQTNEESQIDNVLAFTKRFDEGSEIKDQLNLVKADKPEGLPYRCPHVNVLVDDHLRQLTCRRCGAIVDAFDWINARASGEAKIEWELKTLRTEIIARREGLEKLKGEEVNTKARIRTAQFKLNDLNMAIDAAEKGKAGKNG